MAPDPRKTLEEAVKRQADMRKAMRETRDKLAKKRAEEAELRRVQRTYAPEGEE